MALTAETRLCTACRRPLPDPPAAPACTQCGRVHVVHHSEWSPVLKWWLLAELAKTRFLPWLTEQEAWERLLADSLNGVRNGSAAPNPNRTTAGRPIALETPVVELFATAVERANAWRAAGSHIAPATTPAKRSA